MTLPAKINEVLALDVARLLELFSMDADTGRLYWASLYPWARSVKIGDEAGTPHKDGYVTIKIGGRFYLRHRIVFAMTHGRWPARSLDHINGIRSDDRPCNLREVTSSQNNMNTALRSNNTSGRKGVSQDRRNGRWYARIAVGGERVLLGYFDDYDQACQARTAAEIQRHGEFRRMA